VGLLISARPPARMCLATCHGGGYRSPGQMYVGDALSAVAALVVVRQDTADCGPAVSLDGIISRCTWPFLAAAMVGWTRHYWTAEWGLLRLLDFLRRSRYIGAGIYGCICYRDEGQSAGLSPLRGRPPIPGARGLPPHRQPGFGPLPRPDPTCLAPE